MRTWQVQRRKRTRHLIELGGLVMKAGVVDLTGDDRATILGALLWMADKLRAISTNKPANYGPQRGNRRSRRPR
jgi:conjugative transfer protein TraD